MMKLKVNKELGREDYGILYVVLIELEGKSLVKIGVTGNSIETRMSGLLVDIFKKYREFPFCKPKRFKKVEHRHDKESILHDMFKEYRYETKHKFGGYTEFFEVSLDKVVTAYDKLLSDDC